MSTCHYHPSWWGLAEPIYVAACPRTVNTVVGSVNNVRYINITTTSENGIFLSGSSTSFLKGLHFQNVSVSLARWTNFTAGFHDYRPGCQGLVMHRMSGLFMEYVQDVWLQKVLLEWKASGISDWGLPFDITPSTVFDMHFVDYENTFVP